MSHTDLTFYMMVDPPEVLVRGRMRSGALPAIRSVLGAQGGPWQVANWSRSTVPGDVTVHFIGEVPTPPRDGIITALEAAGLARPGTARWAEAP